MPSPLPPLEVAAALIFQGQKLLITQRRPDDHLSNLCEFPGGKVEPGETLAACLVREIREELGVEIAVGKLVEDLIHSYPEKTVRLCFFECRIVSGDPKPLHVQDLRWVTRDELRHYDFPAADAKLIERLSTTEW